MKGDDKKMSRFRSVFAVYAAMLLMLGSFAVQTNAQKTRNEKEIRNLAATRDFLLPKLISGEVRVDDAASLV